ncbi:MAG: hypothetical protein HOC77_06165 [Chloroflexi bacterium]|jgi:hypothetical protein|nr:hypothetical protein [Chloroflexota bacterium]MBT4072534.1 hypothetical protein [Chloroflexota bacterium]MBT4514659.1 hypothetical protein [Chloroflexota bacterium]MBT6682177.1 hypothetical protein [Chloroflexota bacterium]
MNGALRTGLVLMISALVVVAAACGDDSPPDAEFAPRLEVLAPIDEAELITVGDQNPEYQLRVVSGLPNGCAQYKNTTVKVVDSVVVVDVRNTIPQDGRVACTAVYGSHERTVELPGLSPATDYTVSVNGVVQLELTTEAKLDEGIQSVLAPLVNFRLELISESPLQYEFVADSGLESSCMTRGEVAQTRSGGRLFGNVLRISVTNLEEVDPTTVCADEFTPYEVRVLLTGDFEPAGEYILQLNFKNQYDFVGGETNLRLKPPTA